MGPGAVSPGRELKPRIVLSGQLRKLIQAAPAGIRGELLYGVDVNGSLTDTRPTPRAHQGLTRKVGPLTRKTCPPSGPFSPVVRRGQQTAIDGQKGSECEANTGCVEQGGRRRRNKPRSTRSTSAARRDDPRSATWLRARLGSTADPKRSRNPGTSLGGELGNEGKALGAAVGSSHVRAGARRGVDRAAEGGTDVAWRQEGERRTASRPTEGGETG